MSSWLLKAYTMPELVQASMPNKNKTKVKTAASLFTYEEKDRSICISISCYYHWLSAPHLHIGQPWKDPRSQTPPSSISLSTYYPFDTPLACTYFRRLIFLSRWYFTVVDRSSFRAEDVVTVDVYTAKGLLSIDYLYLDVRCVRNRYLL